MGTISNNVVPKKKLQKRIIWSFLSLVVGMMIVVMLIVAFVLITELKKGLIASLSSQSFHAVKSIEQRINYLHETVINFSQNHFIINSLVHAQGREEYLAKMMEDFGKLESIHSVTVLDYAGKLVHSNIPNPSDYQKTLYLRPVLETAESIVSLSKDAKYTIIVEPILHYDTAIGAVVAEIDINDIAAHFLPHKDNIYYKLYSQETLILSHNFQPTESYIVTTQPPEGTQLSQLSSLHLRIDMGAIESIYMHPVRTIVYRLLGISAIFFTITLIIAAKLGNSLARPILGMVRKTFQSESGPSTRYSPLGTGDELEILALALDTREAQLWEYKEHLEEQVNERTAELTIAKEQAEDNAKKLNQSAMDMKIKNVELEEAREKAEVASKAKSEFLANMSHEIRTPMNAVIGFSDLLSSLITDKKQKTYIESVQTAGKSLLTLINDILDLSKVEAGMLEIQYEATTLPLLMQEIDQIFKGKIQEKNLEFFVEIDPEVPEVLMLDEVRVRQALINLVGNSIKFTETGHIKLSIKQNTIENHSKIDIFITVEDTGIGIPQDQQEAIFESFRQQDGQSTRKFGGTGLGLSLTKKLIEMMDGRITVESTPGQGSIFTIHLREVIIPSVVSPTNKHKKIFDLRQYVFEPSRILVVDDIEFNRNLLRETLTRNGLEILEADNGQKALIFAEEYHPEVILMDIRMPVMDGYEATKQLRANPKTTDIPIIALTASVKKDEQSMLEDFGFDGYLLKPVNMHALYEELFQYIKSEKTITTEESQQDTQESSLAKSWVTPPELMESLENKVWKQWEVVKSDGIFDSIEDFGNQLFRMGEDHAIPPLLEFGETLRSQAENFDIDGINTTLGNYPSLIEQLKTQE